MRLDKLYLVTCPNRVSTFGDIVIEATPATLRLQYLGGLEDGRQDSAVIAWFDNRDEAETFAGEILKARDRFGPNCINARFVGRQ